MTATTLERIDKARRLLIEGRLTVVRVHGDWIKATVRGDSGEVYQCGHNADEARWWCHCEARSTCGHIKALQLVTVRHRG